MQNNRTIPSRIRSTLLSGLWLGALLVGMRVGFWLGDYGADEVLGAHLVTVYGTCTDYFDNPLNCNPDDAHPGRGVSQSPGSLVQSSGCFGGCKRLEHPVSYRQAPFHADFFAGAAGALGVMALAIRFNPLSEDESGKKGQTKRDRNEPDRTWKEEENKADTATSSWRYRYIPPKERNGKRE